VTQPSRGFAFSWSVTESTITEATTGQLYKPRMMMDNECRALGRIIGRRECSTLEKTCPSVALSTTNPIWPDPGLNPVCSGEKQTSNRPSYVTATKQWLRRVLSSGPLSCLVSTDRAALNPRKQNILIWIFTDMKTKYFIQVLHVKSQKLTHMKVRLTVDCTAMI
jgi:hypothetical protein